MLTDSREKGRKGERDGEEHPCEKETSTSCLSYMPQPGTEPETHTCAQTGNQIRDPLAHRMTLQPPEPHQTGQVWNSLSHWFSTLTAHWNHLECNFEIPMPESHHQKFSLSAIRQRYDIFKNHPKALAGVPQCFEHWPENWNVPGSIPSQGTCLGCGSGPQLGACERQLITVSFIHWCFSPSFFPFLLLALKLNK